MTVAKSSTININSKLEYYPGAYNTLFESLAFNLYLGLTHNLYNYLELADVRYELRL